MKNLIKLLKKEIKWHNVSENAYVKSKDYRDGFINGLNQAIIIIKTAQDFAKTID